MSRNPRATHARIAAHTRWAHEDDREAALAPARAHSPASLTYWERQVDPDGQLDPTERAKRAKSAHRAHMSRLAAKRWATT